MPGEVLCRQSTFEKIIKKDWSNLKNFIPLRIIPFSIIPFSTMKNSPFIYGSTVSKHAFTNREAEIKKLGQNLLGGVNTIIISPRRWGKSSLVEKVASEIQMQKSSCRIAMLDLFTVSTEVEFLETFAREVIKASSSKWEDWVKYSKILFKNIIPKIQISSDPSSDFSISFDWQEIKKHSDEIINLPETIAQQKKIKLIICIDEFQNLANLPNFEAFEKKLRALWQRHKSVTYCLYGSKRHMMSDLFNNPSKPFYRFGDIIMLPKIEQHKWIKFICESFNANEKFINEKNAELIAGLMQNHSWYVQQLAHYTWNLTQKKATQDEVKIALIELINANTPLYQNEIVQLSVTQLNLLRAIAGGANQLTSAKVMQEYFLGTPRNVSKNKTILIDNDIIQFSNNKYEFLDPAFELWFRHHYLNQSFHKRFT